MNNILSKVMDELETSNMEMLEQAEYFDSLNAEDFENMDNAEFAEYLDFLDDLEDAEVRKGRKKHAARKHRGGLRRGLVPKKKKKKHVVPLKGRAKLSATGGGGGYKAPHTSEKNPAFASAGYIQQVMATSKGDLNITVIRQTANIALALPYILFDSNGFQSSYVSTLKQYLPAGVTAVASVDPATGDVLITYTQGANVDIIRITLTGSQISYSEFLNNMNTNFFKTFYIRQEYQNTADLLLSVSQTINFGLLSALGMNNKNNLLPRSRRLSSDFQTFIVNLFISEQRITSDFSFVQNAIAVANTTIAWDVFMSERTNLNNM